MVAITLATIILIRPQFKNDVGVVEHEKVHVKQFWRYWGLFPFLYLFSKTYRLKFEVEAFKKQLEFNPSAIGLYAKGLSENYNLNVSRETIESLLKG